MAERTSTPLTNEERARLSEGGSSHAIYRLVEHVSESARYGAVVDIGCGTATIARRLRDRFDHYIGCDVVAYDGFPLEPWATFVKVDLESVPFSLADASADLVMCIEVIEHVENPRALMREIARIAKPGGRIIVTTPNQLSLLSKLSLVTKNQFVAFQEAPGLYPSHITALVEADLRRMAAETGLSDVEIHYTSSGRIPLTARLWPRWLKGRAFSDNVLLTARR